MLYNLGNSLGFIAGLGVALAADVTHDDGATLWGTWGPICRLKGSDELGVGNVGRSRLGCCHHRRVMPVATCLAGKYS